MTEYGDKGMVKRQQDAAKAAEKGKKGSVGSKKPAPKQGGKKK